MPHRLSDDDLRWLAERLRAFGPEREAPTAYMPARKLEGATGEFVALSLSDRDLTECQVVIEAAMQAGEPVSESLRALRGDAADSAAES